MLFKADGDKTKPVILLLHGGGLSDWSFKNTVNLLMPDYHVVSAIIDGHGEDTDSEYTSIEDSSNKTIKYIKKHFNGHVFAICGLSIGAQIVCEMLVMEKQITKYAVIESALVYPIKFATALTVPTYHLMYGLIKKRWFSKMQAKTLCVPENLFEIYYNDSLKMTKQSLINITKSNGSYSLNPIIESTNAKVLVIVGEKEIGIMKKSAKLIHERIKGSRLYIAPKLKHGEFSLVHDGDYVNLMKDFFSE